MTSSSSSSYDGSSSSYGSSYDDDISDYVGSDESSSSVAEGDLNYQRAKRELYLRCILFFDVSFKDKCTSPGQVCIFLNSPGKVSISMSSQHSFWTGTVATWKGGAMTWSAMLFRALWFAVGFCLWLSVCDCIFLVIRSGKSGIDAPSSVDFDEWLPLGEAPTTQNPAQCRVLPLQGSGAEGALWGLQELVGNKAGAEFSSVNGWTLELNTCLFCCKSFQGHPHS